MEDNRQLKQVRALEEQARQAKEDYDRAKYFKKISTQSSVSSSMEGLSIKERDVHVGPQQIFLKDLVGNTHAFSVVLTSTVDAFLQYAESQYPNHHVRFGHG